MVCFYTYLWLREDGTPYYAGKGHGNRAFERDNHRFCPPADPENILVQEWPDETGAFEGEKLLIAIYGRKDNGTGCLRNLTDGGENPPRTKKGSRSVAFCRAISERNKGNTFNLGRTFPKEHRARIAASLRGKHHSAERRARESAARKAYFDREFLKTVAWG